ncbi:MAG: hypothetical protein ACQEVT_08945 [Pseudomonadota bacterium]|uniref:hypothetical protein n=1 Tax=Roseovarius TaxID=74030 RepID=UPI0022A8B08B|nr:hypothetical protein [Roseovarius sp. EGI FJ00037]MCZ0813078.1 hypothetical protein [Roseovarius sp. EGI FJ00037]
MSPLDTITNRPFDSLEPGDGAKIEHRVSIGDMRRSATQAADTTDHGIDRVLVSEPDFRAALAQGGIAVTPLITLMIARIPGRGTLLDALSLDFPGVLKQGDMAVAEVGIALLDTASRKVQLDCRCRREDGTVMLTARSGVRQHLGQEPQLSGPGRCGGDRARGPCADRADQPGRQRA